MDHAIEGEEPGRTECRTLTPDDLPSADTDDFSTELEYLISEDHYRVIACEPGEAGVTGFECYPEDSFGGEAESLGLLRGGESMWVCWPSEQPNVIVRSLVIGDDLWTLGFQGWGYHHDGQQTARLHVNDLSTLERLAALEL